MDMTPQAWPDWYDGKHINEVLFCQQFLDKHPMKCVRGRLFTVDGLIEDEGQIGNLILEEISGVLTSGLSKVVTNLLASIKLQAYSPPLPIETDRIHVSNGTYFIDGSFTVVKSYCNNRLTVAYNPDAPTPKKWLQFLSELLQPEDIPTLQEFLGYCLLPTTKGQKMLMLIGKGGEGKSRIGLVMRSLLGDSIAALTEDLEELRSEKNLLLASLAYTEEDAAEQFPKDIAAMEQSLKRLEEREQKYSAELDAALNEYAGLREQAQGFDPVQLYEARQAIRPGKEQEAESRAQQVYGEKYSPLLMFDSKKAVSRMLHEDMERQAVRRMMRRAQEGQQIPQKKKDKGQER